MRWKIFSEYNNSRSSSDGCITVKSKTAMKKGKENNESDFAIIMLNKVITP